MQKTLAIIFISLSSLIILDSLDFGHALMLFLFAGVIPGTSITLSPVQTLELFALLIGVVMGRISASLIVSLHRGRYFQPTTATLEV